MLRKDFQQVDSFLEVLYLPNGVEKSLTDSEFKVLIDRKYKKQDRLNILYLSNMIKSKGYFTVLELSNQTKEKEIHYHFAGGWQCRNDEIEFFDYVEKNKLEGTVEAIKEK